MFIERKKLTAADVKRAAVTSTAILLLIFLSILFAFWNMQVLHSEYYRDLALKNMIKSVDLPAPRGVILDRRGQVLAENKLNFTLYLIRENIQDLARTIRLAAFLTSRPESHIRAILKRYEKYPLFYTIPLKTNVPLNHVVFIESRPDEFREFKIGVQPLRAYPRGNSAAHVLGYVSEISEEQLREMAFANYKMGDIVGASGVEKQYEEFLQGRKGSQTLVKDNLEKVQRIIPKKTPEIGRTVALTLDLELQHFAEGLLGEQKGVIGVVDLRDGGILALVSKPDFNPERFSLSQEMESWLALINDPEKPLQNKFLQGIYSPGSVFKIVMALAALQEGVITPATTFTCRGSMFIYDRVFGCWNTSGHGTVSIYQALERSCNIFFYNLGLRLDINTIAHYAGLLGLGQPCLIDQPNQSNGLVPTPEWKRRVLHQPWFPGETISVAIGHGSLSVTPAQILNLICTVARRGQPLRFHLLDHVSPPGLVRGSDNPPLPRLPIEERHFETVIEGLWRVVNGEGTGGAARITGLDICGKTGTAQIITKENPDYDELIKQKRFTPHSWFAAFAPRQQPRLALVVLVENGGDGSHVAAPLAARIFHWYFDHEGHH